MNTKKLLRNSFFIALLGLVALATNAQTVVTITGDITSNTTWTNDKIYLLSGFVYVDSSYTLTIQPGTVIKGDKSSKGSLIITRGAKLIADGTLEQPIVFTSNVAIGSRAYGDWGGLIILGRAPINDPAGQRLIEGGIDATKGLYGGNDAADNSGILRFVRIEFPGIAFQPNNEINGLTLGSVGTGTTIEHVQVSYSGDDSFEWFGGTVNNKNLIAYLGWDDDFDTDFGFSGNVQFGVALRDSAIADVSGSNGFESDNNNDAANSYAGTPQTHAIFSNISVFGPLQNAGTPINSNFKRAAHLRRNTALCTYNSVFAGFPTGLKVENGPTLANITGGLLEYKNNVIAGCTNPLDTAGLTTGGLAEGWFNLGSNTVLANVSDVTAPGALNYTAPNFIPQGGSPLLSGASFTSANISGSWFTPTTYRGAFGTDDWTKCWTEFDPANADYSIVPINYGFALNVTQSGSLPSLTLTADNVAGATYAWSNGGNSATTTVTAGGDYTVTVTSARGCTKTVTTTIATVGIKEVSNVQSIQLYPNPTNGLATLEITTASFSSAAINVTDVIGREVAAMNADLGAGLNKISINTSSFAGGVYFLNVRTGNESKVVRMVVNK